ncbi:hypothetical protein, partial [Allochromatium palmeri]|uniref:hypothetical protein n=1 Tax=Allochromatium palmeri TaxID=231048 RepID=UPI001CA3DC3F
MHNDHSIGDASGTALRGADTFSTLSGNVGASADVTNGTPVISGSLICIGLRETLIKYRLLFVNTESALFHKHFVFSGYVMSVSRSIQWPVRPISATCRSSYH